MDEQPQLPGHLPKQLTDQFDALWQRSLDAYVRYYGAVGRLTVDYLKDVVAVWSGLSLPMTPGNTSVSTSPLTAPRAPASSTQTKAQATGTMVLEGEAGGQALGVFLVENHHPHEVTAHVSATDFKDEAGHSIQPTLTFDPETITLRPGEQLLVRVLANISETMEPDARYQGQLIVPGLTGTQIPIVLRRRASQEPPPARRAPTKTKTKTRTRKTMSGRGETRAAKTSAARKKP